MSMEFLDTLWNIFQRLDDNARLQFIRAYDALYDVNSASYDVLCVLSYALCAPYGNNLTDKADNNELSESDTRLINRLYEITDRRTNELYKTIL